MKLLRYPTQAEWEKIVALGPGVRMYNGMKTLFWNGVSLYDEDTRQWLIYDCQERRSWQVIIVLPGVEVIPKLSFYSCTIIKTVIMPDSGVKRIEDNAFGYCICLVFIKLSRALEYIGEWAFRDCDSLTSIFIPPSCREIANYVFDGCEELIILSISPHTQLGANVIASTALIEASKFKTDGMYGHYEDTTEVSTWIKSINDAEGLALHRICSSDNPDTEQVYRYVKDHGLRVMKLPNSIGITPLQYLAVNPYSEIDEGKLVKKYILEMMGEVV
ncbi:hypothetical protein CTEN210_03615 [Chaetoceros tenuissimus]|uniref:Leucine-rich repeat domain-containing protein n=1 Tax=Chaetoceros tenuissimus TaxID=426638 RepID=A0AAD3CL96_9STRA|nr:hypothetical protein CTEN210_03615 [Chaetoceros tenuissimus]